MAKLPRAVQRQLDQADATLAAMNTPAQPVVAEPAPPPADPAPPPLDPQPIADPPPAPPPVVPAPNEWEQRYRSLQGIHRKTADDLRVLQGQFAQLESRLAPPPAPTEPPKPAADPKDVEAFGLDMVSMVQRIADQFIGSARQSIEARFQRVEGEVLQLRQAIEGTSQTVVKSNEDRFFDAIQDAVPEWEQINTDARFIAYLGEVDPIYGLPRRAALENAQANFDATRAVNVFKAFIATLPPPPATAPPASPTPRGAGSPPPSAQPPVEFIKESVINGFYADVRRGLYRNRQQEAAALEAKYNAALSEGRVLIGH
jgi:hypothetical protein